MIRGIIYMYTSPSGKSYIGQTIDEKRRRQAWFAPRFDYAGDKINKARAKYGRDSFKYEVLFSRLFSTKEEAISMLDVLEIFYIGLYNTIDKGYNNERGGHNCAGRTLSEEQKKNISRGVRSWQHTPEGKAKLSAAHKGKPKAKGYRVQAKFTPVVQLTLDGEFIREHPSMRDAEEWLYNRKDITKNRTNIGPVCNGKRDSAEGYKWLFKNDYYTYFLHPERQDIPKRVQRALDYIVKRHIPKVKKKYKPKPRPKKEGPKINRFAQQIGQYDTNLQLVKVWRNGIEAAKTLKIVDANIYRATRTQGMYMGYYWRKYNGEKTCTPKEKKVSNRTYPTKKVVQMDLQGNEIQTFNSIGEACISVNANNRALLSRCLNGKAHTAYGYKWKFLNCA